MVGAPIPSIPEQEPTLAVVVATIAGLERHVEDTIIAMDRRIEQRFDANDKSFTAALITAKEAVEKAEVANAKRFDSVNEFRGQLTDQAATFLTKDVSEQQFMRSAEDIDQVRNDVSALRREWAGHLGAAEGVGDTKDEGRAQLSLKVATGALLVAVGLGVLDLVLTFLFKGWGLAVGG